LENESITQETFSQVFISKKRH